MSAADASERWGWGRSRTSLGRGPRARPQGPAAAEGRDRPARRPKRGTRQPGRGGALAAAANVTFEECAEQYFKFHSRKWNNAKHAAQFLSTMKMYAYPALGKLPVAAIDKALVLKAIEPIWYTKTETASRVRGRIEAVLDFAKTRGYRAGENPAAWDGNLVHALPARNTIAKVEHHAALPFVEVPDFMAQLAAREGIAASALNSRSSMPAALEKSSVVAGRRLIWMQSSGPSRPGE